MAIIRPLLVMGARPEIIKMAPVYFACRQSDDFSPTVCLTGQHRELADPLLKYFDLPVAFDLQAMRCGQSLAQLTARLLEGLDDVLKQNKFDCLIAQGDTTSVLAAALAAFYHKLPLVHVEAGLRTYDMQSPWPEEFNRRVAALATTLHCCPTSQSAQHLLAEGVPAHAVRVTGNTVIDALHHTVQRERGRIPQGLPFAWSNGQSLVLVTAHRRENYGEGLENICQALHILSQKFPHTSFVFPVHLNPQIQTPVRKLLDHLPNLHLLPPANYPDFVWLMDRSRLILTDSGGVQEEACALGKRVLVLRDTTERPESIAAGVAELVGSSVERIVARATAELEASCSQILPSHAQPYGDGQAAERIVAWMRQAAAEGWKMAMNKLPAEAGCR